MKRYLLLVLVVTLPAIAETTCLDCFIINSSKERRDFQVQINESSGEIIQTDPGGRSFDADGIFNADTISYQKIRGSELKMTWAYSINKTDLSIKEDFTVEPVSAKYQDDPQQEALVSMGSCKMINGNETRD